MAGNQGPGPAGGNAGATGTPGATVPTPTPAAKPITWDCIGKLVPPIGYRHEVAFVPLAGNPNAREMAERTAREKLIARLCQRSCSELSARAQSWKVGEGNGQACAMAVIENSAYAKWEKALTASRLNQELARVVTSLLDDGSGAGPGGGKSGKPIALAITIDKIADEGVPGGLRALWLREQMVSALRSFAGVQIVEPPTGWAGDGIPRGLQAVLWANVFTRLEGQRRVLEVFWKARVRRARGSGFLERTTDAVMIPEAVAPPKGDPPLPELPQDPTLTIRIEADSGGSLCLGQTTQVFVRSTVDRYIQVYDIYGKGEGLLLFPNPAHPDGRIRAGETIPIGPKEGFRAIPVGDAEVERFLVLGARHQGDLGASKNFRGYCKMDVGRMKAMLAGRGLGRGVVRSGDGFRITKSESCRLISPPDDAEIAAGEAQLAKMDTCR